MKFFRASLSSQILLMLSVIFIGITVASSANLTTTPTGLQANDVSTLSAQLTAASTSLTLNPVKKWINGVKTTGCFDTGSGFILIQDSLGRTEWASFGSKVCSSANITTLSSLVRGLSPTAASFTGGTGMAFDAGASVKVIDYPLIYNNTFKKDVSNNCTASGCLSTSGSGSVIQSVYATATARLQQVGSNPRVGMYSCLADTGQCYDYIGGAWRSRSGSNIINAALGIAGKVEISSTGSILARTAIGSTGAENVLSSRYTTASGGLSGVKKIGYVMVTENTGFASGTLLGQGPTASKYLRGDQTWQTVNANASGVTLFTTKNVETKITGLGSTTFVAIDGSNLTTSVTNLTAGDLLTLNFRGTVTRTGGTPGKIVLDFQVGNNPMSRNGSGALSIALDPGAATDELNLSFTRTIQVATGGSLTVQPLYRNYGGGGGNTFRFNENTSFDVIKAH